MNEMEQRQHDHLLAEVRLANERVTVQREVTRNDCMRLHQALYAAEAFLTATATDTPADADLAVDSAQLALRLLRVIAEETTQSVSLLAGARREVLYARDALYGWEATQASGGIAVVSA